MAFAAALLCCSCRPKGYSQYSWEYHELTDRYDRGGVRVVDEAIAKYDSLMAPLQEILCYSSDVYAKEAPESGLSNFAADALRSFAEKYTGEKMDMAVLNFGGIRSDLPKGAVRMYDVLSIFPFNNNLTILEVEGSAVRRMLEKMARKNKVEALSGVRMKIDGERLVECEIGGQRLDPTRAYKVATIDFLVTGGDGVDWSNGILTRRDTDILLKDVIAFEMKDMMEAGKTLDLKKDGRVVIINPKER